ncbi:hypothetical protein HCN44_004998 [Aphidius gifuensis]|uniref:Coiled-coil domain-containing protein 43 n=1 Tax=Aphidius gifuensis TaxID=684658 RepID=A0A835CQ91_APHGI|nr:coiled-coil domain-containing protein 43 [Aphidius gifuensis]KAF7992654.1 hypothetical protein HCN44_004998 [Aphidius gifuensis]
MAMAINSFDTWLTNKLQELNTDESVFGSYIKGILEGDETEDEKTEALEGIIAGITEDGIDKHVSEILSAWVKWLPRDDATAVVAPTEDVEVRLAKLLDSQNLPKTAQRTTCTVEERRIREAILAQYSEMTDGEESDAEGDDDTATGGGGNGGSGDGGIEKNTNAANIAQQLKEKRERAKLESQEKKEKDKKDREKQKQLKEEKKEKRKTVKGERRR